MKNFLLCTLFIISVSNNSFAQYADLGVGTLKNDIWWINWSNFEVKNNTARIITTNSGLTVTISFSNVSGVVPTPSSMNTWVGSMLKEMYNFSNTGIKPVLYTTTTTSNSKFSISVTASRDGNPVPFSFIVADAEASSPLEQLRLDTDGGEWKSIEFFRNSTQTSNPVVGCNTKSAYITETQHTAVYPILAGQCPILLTEISSNPLTLDVAFDRTVYGATGIAFGILEGVDRGDLPSGYGYANHRANYTFENTCNFNPPFPSTRIVESLKLGSIAGDSDPVNNLDDNADGADEDAISSFPEYLGSGTYSIQVPLANTTGSSAYISGWFDFNQDGTFTANEMAMVEVTQNSTVATLNWTNIPLKIGTGSTSDFAFRFRLSSNKDHIMSAGGYAEDGEVEDYIGTVASPCSLYSISLSDDTSICKGDSVRISTNGTAASYSWFPVSGLSDGTIGNPVAYPSETTKYVLEATDMKGCKSSDSIVITINALPVISMRPDTTICEQGSAMLWAKGGNSYKWSPSTSLNYDDVENPIATPSANTTYYVVVTDMNKCVSTDSVEIKVSPALQSLNLMPSAFTPNNDGKNDCFGLKNWDPISALDFSVYNQWGQKIFYTRDPSDCWDGTFNGKRQQSGAFVYIIKAVSGCGTIDRKGVVMLIRQ